MVTYYNKAHIYNGLFLLFLYANDNCVTEITFRLTFKCMYQTLTIRLVYKETNDIITVRILFTYYNLISRTMDSLNKFQSHVAFHHKLSKFYCINQ